jgi:hypothetical protein
VGDERFHAVNSHDRRTVEAREFGRIEPLLDIRELAAHEMNNLADVNAQIVATDVDVVDVPKIYDVHALLLLTAKRLR